MVEWHVELKVEGGWETIEVFNRYGVAVAGFTEFLKKYPGDIFQLVRCKVTYHRRVVIDQHRGMEEYEICD